jgi:23S rRNA (uracil1939-C5)-methyltransferase
MSVGQCVMGRNRKRLSDQPFELDIDSLDSRGMGLAEHEGKKLRVYDVLPGEKILARYLFGRSYRGKAEMLEVLQASEQRVKPRCPHFGYCSACNLQHMSMQTQLERKETALLQCLEETGQVVPDQVYAPLCGPEWNYRRKARLSVRDVVAKDRVLVGFRERNGRYVADMNECHILREEVVDVLPGLASLLRGLDTRSTVPQIEVACGDGQSALIIRHLKDLSATDTEQLKSFALASGIGVYLQPGGPDSIHLLAPLDFQLQYELQELGLRFQFDPLDFIQVNGGLNQQMVMRALELLDPQKEDKVLDLFCGLGNFSLPLATRAGHVTAVEGSEAMVTRGRSNAILNGLENVEFYCSDLYQSIEKMPWPGVDFNKILLDPPRSGALELLPWIAASKVSRILYISCNPETLARDAGQLVNQYGFRLEGAGVINMFPHTQHSETIALFERDTTGEAA